MGYDEGHRVWSEYDWKGWSEYELKQKFPDLMAILKKHEEECENPHTWIHSPFKLSGSNVVCTKCNVVVAVMPK